MTISGEKLFLYAFIAVAALVPDVTIAVPEKISESLVTVQEGRDKAYAIVAMLKKNYAMDKNTMKVSRVQYERVRSSMNAWLSYVRLSAQLGDYSEKRSAERLEVARGDLKSFSDFMKSKEAVRGNASWLDALPDLIGQFRGAAADWIKLYQESKKDKQEVLLQEVKALQWDPFDSIKVKK
jgi:hypothetical protein